MSYRVFARKYRPQRFEEVVGQEHITQTLQNAITTDRLAQAYLFVGPRGVGKTSTARIFAKALNCHEGPTINPCGVCDACKEIAEGNSLDVLEIDGASNNSVESIRTLRENSAFAPARGPYKIYLIDEVHMLTTAAFNALLKTLEEPPAHVKFLFATTEAQKLPATITSRCQRFDLRRLSEQLIAKHLLFIAEKENITLSPEAAAALARGADGALRDAESMFDQIISFCGTTITEIDVQHIFGFTPSEVVEQLATSLLTQDISSALSLITEQAHAGKDLSRLLGDLIKFLRDLLIFKVHPTEEAPSKMALSETVSSEKLLVLLEDFGEAEGRLRWASDKKLQLDIAIIKAAHLLQEVSLSDVLDVLSSLRGDIPLAELTKKPTPVISPKVIAPAIEKKQPFVATKPITPPKLTLSSEEESEKILDIQPNLEPAPILSIAEKIIEEPASTKEPEPIAVIEKTFSEPVSEELLFTSPMEASTTSKEVPEAVQKNVPELLSISEKISEPDLLTDPWSEAANELANESRLKFGWVTLGKFLERTDNKILIEFPPSCKEQTETLFWPQARKKIQECLSKKLDRKIELVCQFTGIEPPEEEPNELELQEEPIFEKPASSPRQNEKAAPSMTPLSPDPSAAPVLTPEALENFKNDPLIKKALEIFRAEILLK